MHWGVIVAVVIGIILVIAFAIWYKYRSGSDQPGSVDSVETKEDIFVPAEQRIVPGGKEPIPMVTRHGKLMSVDPKDDTIFGKLMLLQMPEWEMRETCGYLAASKKQYVTVKTITVNGIQYEADQDQCVTKLCHGDVIEGLPGQTQQYKLVILDSSNP